MTTTSKSEREGIAGAFVSAAIIALIQVGHTLDTARLYLSAGRWLEGDGDGMLELLVRGSMAAIVEILGEAEAGRFVSEGEFWSYFNDPSLEALIRMNASHETADRLLGGWRRAEPEFGEDRSIFLLPPLPHGDRRSTGGSP